MKQFSLLEIISTATVLLAMVVESSRVFHVVDSVTLQTTHRCTPAPYGMITALPTHSFGDVDPSMDSDLLTPLDVDWCYDESLTAPLFARLQQLHSFKLRLLSHLEHCSMGSIINIATPSRDSYHCC